MWFHMMVHTNDLFDNRIKQLVLSLTAPKAESMVMLSHHRLMRHGWADRIARETWLFVGIPSRTNTIAINLLPLHAAAQELHPTQELLMVVATLIGADAAQSVKAVEIELSEKGRLLGLEQENKEV